MSIKFIGISWKFPGPPLTEAPRTYYVHCVAPSLEPYMTSFTQMALHTIFMTKKLIKHLVKDLVKNLAEKMNQHAVHCNAFMFLMHSRVDEALQRVGTALQKGLNPRIRLLKSSLKC